MLLKSILTLTVLVFNGFVIAGTPEIFDRSLSSENSYCSGFRCQNYDCIPLARRCDGDNDCESGEDEIGCEKDDINECLEDGFCSQICKNLPGSYECSCLPGYTLVNRTCLAQGQEPYLVISTSNGIQQLRLRSQVYLPIHSTGSFPISLDVDPISSRVYWGEVDPIAIYSADISGTGFAAVITDGLSHPEDIAVDYVTKNLYITDSGLKQVLVCKYDGSVCSPLHTTDVYQPRSLALDIPKGLLYWSDWGTIPAIYKSGMDGSSRTTFVSTNITWPNGIVIDHTTDRLYWCDAFFDKIEFITLDGKTRKVLLHTSVPQPYSLAVFEDHLYWSDRKKYSLESCNKFTGQRQHLEQRTKGKRLWGVHVYHPVLSQRDYSPTFCINNGGCSDICLLRPNGRICICPTGTVLSSNGTKCIEESACTQDEFQCLNDFTCIQKQYQCNGKKDCDDASDEQNCTEKFTAMENNCSDSEFQCSNGHCILLSRKCDNRDDCGDGSDETNCTQHKVCWKDKFTCRNGQRIPTLWRCDGENDCRDGSDEKRCENSVCKDTEHRCGNGQCIFQPWRCDGDRDCSDGSDEKDC